MLATENHNKLPLFKHFPALKSKLAWRELGEFPTPVHTASAATPAGEQISFQVKREDLTSPLYGGQKVRTLQHTLAVCESRVAAAPIGSAERAQAGRIGVIGSGGSNQVIATAVHAAKHLPKIEALWVAPDEPDLDNTLNMLSTLSMSNVARYSSGWRAALNLLSLKSSGVVLPLGCNNPAGALGHASAALELAEQIEKGEADDVDAIYLAIGSSCTISGLVVGIALSRQLGQAAFASQSFRLHGVIIHPIFAYAERFLGLHGPRFAFMPLTISHTVREACAALVSLGGPDVTPEALAVVRDVVELHTEPEIVGQYGAHSETSRAAARAYDATGKVVARQAAKEPPPPPLWLCGHFCAKAYAAMSHDLVANPNLRAMLWQTKSSVQPRGPEDEWAKLLAMDMATQEWAHEGKAESELRPGVVGAEKGAGGYRGLMKSVDLGDGVPL